MGRSPYVRQLYGVVSYLCWAYSVRLMQHRYGPSNIKIKLGIFFLRLLINVMIVSSHYGINRRSGFSITLYMEFQVNIPI